MTTVFFDYVTFRDLASNNDNIQAQSEIVHFDSSKHIIHTTRDIFLLKSSGTHQMIQYR